MGLFNRIAQWFKSSTADTEATENEPESLLEFDPAWHGDHWQNLLCSPLDARHYVMEDWATPIDTDILADENSLAAEPERAEAAA